MPTKDTSDTPKSTAAQGVEAAAAAPGGPVVSPFALTVTTVTPSGGSLQIVRNLTITTTGTGPFSITVPHGMSYTPTKMWPGVPLVVAGPAAGPTFSADNSSVANGIDGTNLYLLVSGPGTINVFVA